MQRLKDHECTACDAAGAVKVCGPLSLNARCAFAGLETSLQKVFQEVLGKHHVSVTANFFAEGGNQMQVWPFATSVTNLLFGQLIQVSFGGRS